MRYVVLDFEYNNTTEAKLNVVSCVTYCDEVYKYYYKDFTKLVAFLNSVRHTHTLVTFAAAAEGSAMLSLGIDLHGFKVLDLWAVEKLNRNCDIVSKSVKVSLLETARRYKVMPDEYKDIKSDTRDLILRGEPFTKEEVKRILHYNKLDVSTTLALIKPVLAKYADTFGCKPDLPRLYALSEYVFKCAYIERNGIPIDTELLGKIRQNIVKIKRYHITKYPDVEACFTPVVDNWKFSQEKLTAQVEKHGLTGMWLQTKSGYSTESKWLKDNRDLHPFIYQLQQTLKNLSSIKYLGNEVQTDLPANEYVSEEGKYITAAIKPLYDQLEHKPRTATGKVSYSADNIEKLGVTYGGVFADIVRTKNSINYRLNHKGNDQTMADIVSSQGRIHVYPGMLGTRTLRNAPPAKRFIYAQAAWQRGLIKVPKGKKIVSADWSSQEILIGAVLSKDKNMLKAVMSGDVYLAFGKQCGYAPDDATKETHTKERNVLKATCLVGSTRILTDTGIKELENITTGDKVWNGIDFVIHKGVYKQGYQPVISRLGLTGTPDHKIYTSEINKRSLVTVDVKDAVAYGAVVTPEKSFPATTREVSNESQQMVYDLLDVQDTNRFLVINEQGEPIMVSNCLGIQYGLGVRKMSQTLFPGDPDAKEKTKFLRNGHRNTYSKYWSMVDEFVDNRFTPYRFMDGGAVCLLKSTSSMNHLMQAGGSAILRETIRRVAHKVEIIAMLHDQIDFIMDADDDPSWVLEEMRIATRNILDLPDNFPVSIDCDEYYENDRLLEKGREVFENIMEIIE